MIPRNVLVLVTPIDKEACATYCGMIRGFNVVYTRDSPSKQDPREIGELRELPIPMHSFARRKKKKRRARTNRG